MPPPARGKKMFDDTSSSSENDDSDRPQSKSPHKIVLPAMAALQHHVDPQAALPHSGGGADREGAFVSPSASLSQHRDPAAAGDALRAAGRRMSATIPSNETMSGAENDRGSPKPSQEAASASKRQQEADDTASKRVSGRRSPGTSSVRSPGEDAMELLKDPLGLGVVEVRSSEVYRRSSSSKSVSKQNVVGPTGALMETMRPTQAIEYQASEETESVAFSSRNVTAERDGGQEGQEGSMQFEQREEYTLVVKNKVTTTQLSSSHEGASPDRIAAAADEYSASAGERRASSSRRHASVQEVHSISEDEEMPAENSEFSADHRSELFDTQAPPDAPIPNSSFSERTHAYTPLLSYLFPRLDGSLADYEKEEGFPAARGDGGAVPPPNAVEWFLAYLMVTDIRVAIYVGVLFLSTVLVIVSIPTSQLDVLGGACFTYWGFKTDCDSPTYTITRPLYPCADVRYRLGAGAAFSIVTLLFYLINFTASIIIVFCLKNSPRRVTLRSRIVLGSFGLITMITQMISWAVVVGIFAEGFCGLSLLAYGVGFGLNLASWVLNIMGLLILFAVPTMLVQGQPPLRAVRL